MTCTRIGIYRPKTHKFICLAYFAHPEVKAIAKAIVDTACDDDARVTGDQVSKWAEFVLIWLIVKSNKQYESFARLTKAQIYQALKKPKVFFPYKPATDNDVEDRNNIVVSDNCAFR